MHLHFGFLCPARLTSSGLLWFCKAAATGMHLAGLGKNAFEHVPFDSGPRSEFLQKVEISLDMLAPL